MTDPRDRKLIEVTARLVQENNTILKKIKRSMFLSRVFKVGYWIVIIALAFGAYYFIQPYVENLLEVYSGVREGVDNLQDIRQNIPGVGEII